MNQRRIWETKSPARTRATTTDDGGAEAEQVVCGVEEVQQRADHGEREHRANSDSRQADRKILFHRWIRCPRGSKKRWLPACIREAAAETQPAFPGIVSFAVLSAVVLQRACSEALNLDLILKSEISQRCMAFVINIDPAKSFAQ